ncbi:81bb91b6-6d1d-4362-8c10-3ee3db0c7a44 [Sclerotinia trifoliorum]|uniref:81bb91b6-6d1d-4362-8c10-3ee3db0c7a44 n=1 Tax=Sclerotinia trifoliorum TaxID=28548 RepID=A0A8H2ZPB6_9HELO|nr:81bb91b6-6d1d-4362-8c10-3ee3db0c7a44 [Sclerotinia trifoliorum]
MDKDFESELLLQEQSSEFPRFSLRKHKLQKGGGLLLLLSFIIILLSGMNILQWIASVKRCSTGEGEENHSKYADLFNDEISVQWTRPSILSSTNQTERDHEWDSISYDNGIVAVPKEWAAKKALPMGSSFPWNTSKALYLVNAHHNLHCLKNIYRSVMESQKGQPQSLGHEHLVHCLSELVADVKCNADDTLRYMKVGNGKSTAVGQSRTCRNWEKLEKWTYENAGCYRYGNPDIEDHAKSQIPRFRYCPEGSEDLEHVRNYFGKGSDWKPYEENVWSWDEDWVPSNTGLDDWVKPT